MIKFTISPNSISKDKLISLISIENASLEASLLTQKNMHHQILLFLKNFMGNLKTDIDTTYFSDINHIISEAHYNLKKITFNIHGLEKLLQHLKGLSSQIEEYTIHAEAIQNLIEQYNKEYKIQMHRIFINATNIQNYLHKLSFLDLSVYISAPVNITSTNTNSSFSEEKMENIVENRLIISEQKGKVLLPYTKDDLQFELLTHKGKYHTFQEVIDQVYTRPISYYKPAAISRFKEAYHLIVNKEHGSKLSAFSLAIELFSNYNLHPAIISACHNLNELDIYLSCLEDNELQDFHFFKIEYEVPPVPVKKLFPLKNQN